MKLKGRSRSREVRANSRFRVKCFRVSGELVWGLLERKFSYMLRSFENRIDLSEGWMMLVISLMVIIERMLLSGESWGRYSSLYSSFEHCLACFRRKCLNMRKVNRLWNLDSIVLRCQSAYSSSDEWDETYSNTDPCNFQYHNWDHRLILYTSSRLMKACLTKWVILYSV